MILSTESIEHPEQKDKKLLRLDTGSNLFDQMTSVFDQVMPVIVTKLDGGIDTGQSSDRESHLPAGVETAEEVIPAFGRKNCTCLLQLNGANILVDTCAQLLFLSKYQQRYKEALAGSAFLLPATLSEALTTRNR